MLVCPDSKYITEFIYAYTTGKSFPFKAKVKLGPKEGADEEDVFARDNGILYQKKIVTFHTSQHPQLNQDKNKVQCMCLVNSNLIIDQGLTRTRNTPFLVDRVAGIRKFMM